MDKEDAVYVCVCICMCVYTHLLTHTHTHTQWNTTQPLKKKRDDLPFATTWLDLEVIMLSEISQS